MSTAKATDRPALPALQSLEQLLDQKPAMDRLIGRLRADRVPHALLFQGPKSTGKRSAAQLLAKALLCEARTEAGACGHCRSCQKCVQGSHMDLIELDRETGAISVAWLRGEMARLSLKPREGRLNLLLIPDAERMNTAAQNALLKTLEEPPEHAKLILTTARPELLIATVRSRCQRVDFRERSLAGLRALIQDARGVSADDAERLAVLSEGQLSTALSMDLQKAIQDREQVIAWDLGLDPLLGPKGHLQALDVAERLGKDRAEMLGWIALWQSWLRDQLILASGARTPEIRHRDQIEGLEQGAARGLNVLIQRAKALEIAAQDLELPFNYAPRLTAERLCLRLLGHVFE